MAGTPARQADAAGAARGRVTVATGRVHMNAATVEAIHRGDLPKGNPLVTARVAALLGARRTGEFIPGRATPDTGTLDVGFVLDAEGVRIAATTEPAHAAALAFEGLAAVALAALSIYDVCKTLDKAMRIADIALAPAGSGAEHEAPRPAGGHRPATGILVLSDTIAAGRAEDRSGALLREAFEAAGCEVRRFAVIPDDAGELLRTVRGWIDAGTGLIITSGGTGLGPRDITVDTLEPLFTSRLPGIEQALHARGRRSVSTAMLSRLAAGMVGDTMLIALPGSAGAARDAVEVLIPAVFHAWPVRGGSRHD